MRGCVISVSLQTYIYQELMNTEYIELSRDLENKKNRRINNPEPRLEYTLKKHCKINQNCDNFSSKDIIGELSAKILDCQKLIKRNKKLAEKIGKSPKYVFSLCKQFLNI